MNKLQVPLAFLLVIIIWTSTPLAVQWSSGSAPLTSAMLRMLIGVLFCSGLMALFRMHLPHERAAIHLYSLSGLSMYVSMSLIYLSAQSMPSGWIAIVFGLSPLITGVVSAFVEPDSKLTTQRVIGILLGFMGLSLVFRVGLTVNQSTLSGIFLLCIAVTVSASSSVFIRQLYKDTSLQPMQVNVGSLLVALPFFTITAWLFEPSSELGFTLKEISAIVFLGTIGTGVGFTLYFYLLKRVPASKVALVTLITPISALLLGNLVNNEPVIPEVWLGAGCVCIGLLLYEYKPRLGLRKL